MRGLDFTSRPTRRKPSMLAVGRRRGDEVRLQALQPLFDEGAYHATLRQSGPWVMGCDFPFGLARTLVQQLGWPQDWPALMAHYGALSRQEIRATFAAYCAARPAGAKFAHRACEAPAGASPAMKWVNPPVAYMLHAGVPPLREAGCELPGLQAGDAQRVALEAYPGLLARDILGRQSYKSDESARQTPERQQARQRLLAALEAGQGRLGLRLCASAALRHRMVADASGDSLDAALCLLAAAWAAGQPRWGLPEPVDPLEGWIVGATPRATPD